MGVIQNFGFGTVLLLQQSNAVPPCQSERFTKILDKVDNPPSCIQGSTDDLCTLDTHNVWALIISGWTADEEGVSLLQDARTRFPKLQILVVGAVASEVARIAAYEAGADDYVLAACSEREFSARLKCLLRRCNRLEESISIADLTVWTGPRVVQRSGQPIKLSTKEMELLLYLVKNRSRPVSRAGILKHVFGLSFEPGTNVVEVHIHRLRQKIDGGGDKPLLKTVRGVGYVLDEEGISVTGAPALPRNTVTAQAC